MLWLRAVSLDDWDMRFDRNCGLFTPMVSESLDDWDMRFDRNYK